MLKKLQGGCSVGFFGLGRSNMSLLRTLPLEKCSVTLRSDSVIDRTAVPRNARIFERADACLNIDEDIIFFSPSVRRERPEFDAARARGVVFTSDAELFFKENKRPLFAVTGSDGKSTTAALCDMLLNAGGGRATSVGNMGEPMVAKLWDDCDIYVAELSSFMLTYATPNARRACLTNLTPNHLDWHRDLEEYKKTKINLLKCAEEFVISDKNADIKGAYGIVSFGKGFAEISREYKAEIYITCEDGFIKKNGERVITIEQIRRHEEYNLKNLMMALAMTEGYVDADGISKVAREFSGLAHRCERFLSYQGVDYYDSSIDTSPARTAETLRSLGRRVVIILGGRDKGLNYGILCEELKKYAACAVLVGENKDKIYSQIKNHVECHIAEDFPSAVRLGKELTKGAEALLLSPASASYDLFRDYAHRGDEFQKIIIKDTENEKNLS